MNNIIRDYLSLTGRPAATLSVEEYLKFLEYATQSQTTPIDSEIKTEPKSPRKSEETAPVEEQRKNPREKEERKPIPMQSQIAKEENHSQPNERDNILKMLQSVSG